MDEVKSLTPKDLKSDIEVKWCAGCGDHAILAAVQRAIPQTGVKQENVAIISGIGCSSRFPYYMNCYGFHSIHGRGSAIASGLKTARPELSVWQTGGDGDMLAIGGNHFIHSIRRNINLNVLLFNNEIYGLTKGQYSPTTRKGEVTKTSPFGTVEQPFNPGEITLGANGRFFARTVDNNIKHMTTTFTEAALFSGTSVVEILQNCVIFNHDTHAAVTGKEVKDYRQIYLEHGKPMLFGKKKEMGLVLENLELKVVKIGENGISESDILIHDAHQKNQTIHNLLVKMKAPEFPVAFGIIRAIEDDTLEDLIEEQNQNIQSKNRFSSVNDLLLSGNTWEV